MRTERLRLGRVSIMLLVIVLVLSLGAVLVSADPGAGTQAATQTYNTLRVYGDNNEGAGNPATADPVTTIIPEEAPYTDAVSIFDPRGLEAPIKDFVTWDPAWLSELDSTDELAAYGLYQRIFVNGLNGAEKVWLREWYEPVNLYLDMDASGDLTLDPDGNPDPNVDVFGPAIMQEYTYQLVQNDYARNEPDPTYGAAGRTSFVFPVGMRGGDLFVADSQVSYDPFGYGLTSLDADFDGVPDIVRVESEQTLEQKTGRGADFDGNGVLDPLNVAGTPLSGEELAVLSLDPKDRYVGEALQFLDHMVVLTGVTNSGVTLEVWYTGDIVPFYMGTQSIQMDEMYLYGRHFPGTLVPASPAVNAGVPSGAWYVQVTSVDTLENRAQLRVGRALGAPYSAMMSAPSGIDLSPGDPWFLKRFFVDGHQYDVTAIGTQGTDDFGYITLRTPVPKEDVLLELNSVRLQSYGFQAWLSMLPPFNYEHTSLHDVRDNLQLPGVSPWEPLRWGEPYGPVPPILQRNGPFPYRAYRLGGPSNVVYSDPEEMLHFYVREDPNLSLLNEHKELYGDDTAGLEFWYASRNWTIPYLFTEFVFPDVNPDRTGDQPDLYQYTAHFRTTITDLDLQAQLAAAGIPWYTINDLERVNFWYDQAEGGLLLKDSDQLRVFGYDSMGPGDDAAADPAGYPVEVFPYTDTWAPFNPKHVQAPPGDSVSFNPAYMNAFRNSGEQLAEIYGSISYEGADAREKVFTRMWYEPDYLDKLMRPEDPNTGQAEESYRFPALMFEYTTMLLDTQDRPAHGQPGNTNIVFPMATGINELPRPETTSPYGLPAAQVPSFGYGLTSYDANFDDQYDIVRVHSEQSLRNVTGISADFDGDGNLDQLDADAIPLSGNELAILAVENIVLERGESAQFLDHLVTVENVTQNGGGFGMGTAQLQIWNTGGGLHPSGGEYSLHPDRIGGTVELEEGEMAITGADKLNITVLPVGGDNLGSLDGPWFVYVSGINSFSETVTLSIGRALGGSHSAIDDGNAQHDMEPGDPWYLKRFFVDGHEYNVVALHVPPTESAGCSIDPDSPAPECYEFKYLTLRTPLPKLAQFVNQQDTQALEGYFRGTSRFGQVDTDIAYVMPPFNVDHTIAQDIMRMTPEQFQDDRTAATDGDDTTVPNFDGNCQGADAILGRPAVNIGILAEDIEPRFTGELREIRSPLDAGGDEWIDFPYATRPDAYTAVSLPADELYLLTSSWTSEEADFYYYQCTDGDPTLFDPVVPLDNDRVQYTYSPGNDEDIYINTFDRDLDMAQRALEHEWNMYSTPLLPVDPASDAVLAPIVNDLEVALGYECGVGGLSYYPTLPPSINTLKNVTGYYGYWLKTFPPSTLDTYGWRLDVNTPLYLCTGWNFIPYLGENAMPVRSALSGIDGYYTAVLGYNGGALSFYPDLDDSFNTLKDLEPNFGYWINMTQPATLRYPDIAMQSLGQPAAQTPSGVKPTNRWMDFYGADSSVKIGDVVQAYTSSGLLVGEVTVTYDNQYGLMPIYGDDPTTDEVDGAQTGEWLTFMINGQRAFGVGPDTPIWTGDRDRAEFDIIPEDGVLFLPVLIK